MSVATYRDYERSAPLYGSNVRRVANTPLEKWSRRFEEAFVTIPPRLLAEGGWPVEADGASIQITLSPFFNNEWIFYNVYGVLGAIAILCRRNRRWQIDPKKLDLVRPMFVGAVGTNKDFAAMLREHTSLFQILVYAKKIIHSTTL